jgi:hypothetical protein
MVVACGLLVVAAGGVAIWRSVDRLDEAWARHTVVQGEMTDLEAMIGARLDEAVGVVGLDSSAPTSDADLQAQLGDLFDWAGVHDDGLGDEVMALERELFEAAEASGTVDERRLARLESALRDLDRRTVQPTNDAARAAHDTARRTIAVVLVLLAGSLGAAAWLHRIRRPTGTSP